jgi:Ca-activated chloride channel family protein
MEAYMRRVVVANFAFVALAGLVLVLVATLTMTGRLQAADHSQAATDAAPPPEGGLMLHEKGVAAEMPAMRLGTDIAVTVSGQTARVTVTQAFRNTSDKWMEATYLYPLPDDGAVDTLDMVVGNRIFRGKIKPREEARQIYEKALAEGRKAGLVEQERANMFRNSIANVGPGETVLIAIEFQAPVSQLGNDYALRLPLVVGPRYIPPHSLKSGGDLVDAARVSAPVADPKIAGNLNPVSIRVDLAPGFDPVNVTSPYHLVKVVRNGAGHSTVTLAKGDVPANRDFELRWSAPGKLPALGLFKQRFNGLDYVMASLTPPSAGPVGAVGPREMVFVIDNSGSMSGDSIAAARASLLYALDTLRPQDRFNIIRFDDTMTLLFKAPVAASGEQLAVARRYVQNLDAEGGTEMLPALEAALVDAHPAAGALRQIVFLTDGDLSNEDEMMAEIAAHRGRSRVFMVGIGSAPNTYLMRRMAEAGRGTFTHIGTANEVDTTMQTLLDRLAQPVASELKVTVEGTNLDLVPHDLPDLYAGEPLVLLGRTKSLKGTLTISGMVGDKPWTQVVDLGAARQSDAIGRLWASRRIADIEAQRWSNEIDDAMADAQIEDLGMDFHIVTSRTSLVAEDETPSRPAGAQLTREELPLLLPAGWDFDHLFGGQARDSMQADPSTAEKSEPLDLPQTATGFMAALLQGLALLTMGLIALIVLRRGSVVA